MTPPLPANAPAKAPATRFLSLDVLRGGTVALMIGVNNPGSWSQLYPPLAHAQWHGCTPTDLVFPFFLFAVGNALAFVMPGLQQAPLAQFWGKVVRRTLMIFGLGLLLNAAPFVRWDADGTLAWKSLESLRIMGVLQRIALAWMLAALILRFGGRRRVLYWVAALLLGYWAACLGFGDGADPYSLEGWFGTALDRWLLGPAHLYRGEGVPFDPEGLASTLPAVAQVLLGYWVGERLARQVPSHEVVAWLFGAAVLLGLGAYVWQGVMPINKKIWTSSYVLLTTALAMALLGLLVQHLDLRRRDGAWVRFCQVFGRNPLFVYVMSGLIPRLDGLLRWTDGVDGQGLPRHLTPMGWAWQRLFEPLASDARLGSLLFAVANVAAYWALAWWLDRRRIYIRV
ncbi:acyltransferase family protein [Aquabacterium sp.]|uniref:acyltransferase family protein n=1 Tax=Aquabacterium sp. TaxID=1872578 RepID=UPI002C931399|nr:heparan-alpha-glucosaminide N-acetyltransferase domain-containing protein [Aquabacterium sp.]HSW05265.1 heparan-alpha-glucosaminide N-acetyltransferase domain-containing protein [Aquabacterium sp.]